jgi:hypothetical protein
VRIRRTTRAGASPHPISKTTATDNSVRSGHGGAPSPAVLVYGGPQATSSGLSPVLALDAARTIPLAALLHTTSTGGEVSA